MEEGTSILYDCLKENWGYKSFRPPQKDIIQAILNKSEVLAILPTGAGKSLCYQLPALIRPGVCIVITPLISLMMDQVQQLKSKGLKAIAIHGGMNRREIDIAFDNAVYGNIKFLYISPERIQTELFKQRILKMKVSFIAIDEAHCISQWGHDFRPSYLEIGVIRDYIPDVQFIAFTATATLQVQKEIIHSLGFSSSFKRFKKSFVKENLHYTVHQSVQKKEEIVRILKKVPGTAIVYVRNRKLCRDIDVYIRQQGIQSNHYHAGLDFMTRQEVQKDWMSGKYRVIVATNAFGMGIDKADVRLVIHYAIPDSLESYYQEAGRAGRDMRTAYAVLLDNSQDHFDAEKNLNTSFPDFAFIKDVYAKLCSYFEIGVGSGQDERFEFDIIEFVNHFQLSLLPSLAACKELEKAGWIVLTEAVFEPPKMMILLNRNEIDEFLHQNKATGQLLQVLIRNYEGLFSNYVAFSHKKLARLLDTTIPEIERLLDQLKTIGIIDYKAISEKPILELLQARVSNRNFSIDLKSYKLRKKNAYARLKSMIRYVESTDCREQEILAYFSESKSAPCSRCDLCLGSAKVNYTKDELKHVLELLEKLTKDGPIDFRQFVELYPKHHENRTLTILDHLKHEGIISITDYQIEWTKADG